MVDAFQLRVDQQKENLKHYTPREIGAQVACKRVAWAHEHASRVSGSQLISPRQAFNLLFFDYMGLQPQDLPVIAETEHEIRWLSTNPCPTLEACCQLGLDTRYICRMAYEKSTQAFLSQLDPQLRFLRSYDQIRPYSAACLEWIIRVDFESWMELALQQAAISRREGNQGIGAVVAAGDRILAACHDTSGTQNDPSLHAELSAIRQAIHILGDTNLSGAVLVSTCEPCPMCSSLAVSANLTSIVYGISIEEITQMGKSRIRISSREVVDRSPVMIEIIGGVLHDRCMEVFNGGWAL